MKKKQAMSTTTLLCPQCSGDQFIHPDNPKLDSKITCASCGHRATAAAMALHTQRDQAKRLATEAVRATFGKRLK